MNQGKNRVNRVFVRSTVREKHKQSVGFKEPDIGE